MHGLIRLLHVPVGGTPPIGSYYCKINIMRRNVVDGGRTGLFFFLIFHNDQRLVETGLSNVFRIFLWWHNMVLSLLVL
jgi:hypothetical protein